ncbi:glycosyltransferase family 9 protein [Robertkochia sediminum]|uniref:glycosyltransferase family 9 protein n=1 Tax=Robertkochia sediminum TaxID=2785326 RepID=UPI001931A209|nr:glycosyltransferase family 9 protein [Robertkochia sediminum]MBL7472652.1 glycosyltransferase family 9 protein [Robertkochia sediminum]
MIGDVLTSSILCENLKREFPQATIHYMVHAHTTAVIENHPAIDRIIRFDPILRKKKLKLLDFINTLKKENYDVLIDAYTKIETSMISLLSGIPKTIGFHKNYSAFAYTHPVKRWTESKYGFGLAIEHRLQLLLPILNGKTMNDLTHKPAIYLTPEEREKAADLIRQHGLTPESRPLMISILGSGANKSYPAPYMATFLDQIAATSQHPMLFNYIPKQYEEVKKIYDLCQPETQQRIHLDLFADSLRGFIAFLSHCRALIGNEGGAVNMAKALDLPTFSIFSPWIPRGDWAIFEDEKNKSVHLEDYLPEIYKDKPAKQFKNESLKLYQELKPELFRDVLNEFLEEIS